MGHASLRLPDGRAQRRRIAVPQAPIRPPDAFVPRQHTHGRCHPERTSYGSGGDFLDRCYFQTRRAMSIYLATRGVRVLNCSPLYGSGYWGDYCTRRQMYWWISEVYPCIN